MPFRRGILFFNIKILYICQEIKNCLGTDLFVDTDLLLKFLVKCPAVYLVLFLGICQLCQVCEKGNQMIHGYVYLANCSSCQHQISFCLKSVFWGMGYDFTIHYLQTVFASHLVYENLKRFSYLLAECEPDVFVFVVVESPTAYLQQIRDCWCSFHAEIIHWTMICSWIK